MDLQLHGRRALVTGSTAGIGYAIASRLADEGAVVFVNGRTPVGVDAAVARLRAGRPRAEVHGIAADLGTATGCDALLAAVGPEGVDILVNNLGIFEPKAFDAIGDDDWQRLFDVNVMSGVRLARGLLPRMKARNRGRVVFVSSESGLCPPAEMVHYGMTKSAQLSVARGLAETCAGTAVTVNSVLPGPTLTEGAHGFFDALARDSGRSFDETTRAFFEQARPTSLLRRFITPDEVAATVTYLCSPLAAATTGAAVRVDGGVVRSIA